MSSDARRKRGKKRSASFSAQHGLKQVDRVTARSVSDTLLKLGVFNEMRDYRKPIFQDHYVQSVMEFPNDQFVKIVRKISQADVLRLAIRYVIVLSKNLSPIREPAISNISTIVESILPRCTNVSRIHGLLIDSRLGDPINLKQPPGGLQEDMNLEALREFMANLAEVQQIEELILKETTAIVPTFGADKYFRHYIVSRSDEQLFPLAQALLHDMQSFVQLWQKVGARNPLALRLPDPVRASIILTCEHLIRCLKEDVIDASTLRRLAGTLRGALKKIGGVTVVAAVTAAVTIGVEGQLDTDPGRQIVQVCDDLVKRAAGVDNTLWKRWAEGGVQEREKFDFGFGATVPN